MRERVMSTSSLPSLSVQVLTGWVCEFRPRATARLTGASPDTKSPRAVVRCLPSIVRLVLVHEPGVEIDMTQCVDDVIEGLRFGVALVDRDARLLEVVGYDTDGSVVERFDLRLHDASENRIHPISAGFKRACRKKG
jgi:hypothetical protein